MMKSSAPMDSNHVCESLLHHSESPRAQPQEHRDHGQAQPESGPINAAFATEDAPSKAIDNPDHGVERIDQAPLLRYHTGAETDRRNIHAELNDEWNHVAEIPVLDIERGHPQRGTEEGKEGQEHEKRQHEHSPRRREFIPDLDRAQDPETDDEVDYGHDNGRGGYDKAREIDLSDERRIIDQAVRRFG